MAGRGWRGRGRGSGRKSYAPQVPFQHFPEDVNLPDVKLDEIDTRMKNLLKRGYKFQNYFKASPYFLEETTSNYNNNTFHSQYDAVRYNRNHFRAAVYQPEFLLRVLNSVRDRPVVALRFFRWVEKQPGFKGSESAFVEILHILARNGFMRSAYWVMEKVIGVRIDGVVLDVLVSGCGDSQYDSKDEDANSFF